MTRFRSRFVCALTALTLVPGLAAIASAQNRKPLITGTINNSQRATIAGNTRPEANSANDHGLAAASTPLNALQLLLHRSPENGAAFTQYIEELHNPKSASYHKWLTNAEIGASLRSRAGGHRQDRRLACLGGLCGSFCLPR